MKLPNEKVVDILSEVFEEINNWLQRSSTASEAGGYIVGYQHTKTKNISLEKVSHPYPLDVRNRVRFIMKDPQHQDFLKKISRNKSFYMGVWHTHPQRIPEPSNIDLFDWNITLNIDKTACKYIFFIIAGTEKIRVWIGDFDTKTIVEIFECEKEGEFYKI